MAKDRKELLEEVESFYFNTMIDQGSYLNFLDTMSKFHKYNLREQINIFYNAPENSTALASENIWKRMKRTLKSDAVAIPIIRGEAGQERVELIYDVSDTNEYRENEELLWHIDEERDKEYLDANLQGEGSVEDRVRHICMQMAEGFDGSDEEKNIMGLSLSYVTLKRMGYDASDVSMELISTPWELENPEKVLTEVNTLAKSILNPMGNYVKNGRTNQNDRSRLHISADNTDSRGTGGRNGELGIEGVLRTMGEDQNGVSDRGKEGDVEEPSSGRESGEVSEGLSGEVRPEIRQTVRNDDGERRSDGGTESQRRDGVDSQGETREASGNGDDNSGNQRDGVENQAENNISNIFSFSEREMSENNSNTLYYLASPSQDFRREFLFPTTKDNIHYSTAIPKYAENFNGKIFYASADMGKPVFGFTNEVDRNNFVNNVYSLVESVRNNVAAEEKDNGESASISENNAETAKSYIIKEDYTATNENGESQTHYIAYNSIETGDKITELTGNKAFLEINEIAEKHSGYLNIPSHDNDVPNFGHFSFNTQEDRDAFAIEANAVIDKILANETSTEKDNGESAPISENNAVEEEPLYKYYLNARPVSPGTVPRDFVRFDEEDNGGRYGAVYYNHKLSEETIKEFELTPDSVHNEKYGKLVFQELEMYSPIRNRTYYHALPSEDIPVATLNMLNAIPTAYPKTLIGGEGDGKAFFSFENPQDRDAFIAEANNFIDYANNYHSSEQYNLNKNFSLVLEDSEASENVDPDLALPYLAIPKEEVLKIDSVNALASLSSIARNYGGTTKGIYSNDGLFYRFSTNEAREAFINDTNMFISYIQSRENPSLSDDFALSYSKINDNSQYYFYASPSQDFIKEILDVEEKADHLNRVHEFVNKHHGRIMYKSLRDGVPHYAFEISADRANFLDEVSEFAEEFRKEQKHNTNDAVIDYNEIFDKIDNILKDYGEQKIKLAEALEQLENIDNNENVNRNIFITDRITKVSGFLKDTQKEIDDILAGYEKKEYEYAEAFRRFQSLGIDIINKNDQFENISDIMAESGKNAAENSLNIIRAEHEKLFAEQEAEAARINAEREKNESAQTSSTNTTSSLFTDEEIKATEVKNTNTKDKKNIPEDSPFIISVSRKGLFSDKNFYEASIFNSEIIQDLQDMQDLFKEIADNNNGESAFNLNWKFTFDSEADRDNFVIAANDAINARNAEKTNEVIEENSVQNEQNESEYYIYFTKEGKFGRELVINNHPTRNKENMYKVAAEQGATIISKEEYEKGLAEQRSKIATDRMKELFREDNIEKIFDVLSVNDNTYSIKAFSELSGISLDKTWKRREQQLIDYYGEKYTKWQEELETAAREKEEAEKEAQEANFKKEASEIGEKYYDYAKNLSPMQRARVGKILGTRLRYDDKIQTRAQNIEELFSDGRLAFTYNDFGKIKYAIESSRTGSYYSVTKTEFDYWNYLNENSNVKIKPQHFSTYSHTGDEEYVEHHFAHIPKEQASARYQAAADLEEIAKKYGGYLMTGSADGIESVGFSFETAENMNNFAQEANAYLDQQYGATDSYGEAMSLLSEEETANEEKIKNQNEAENTGENPVQNEQDFTEDNKVSEDSSFVQNIVGDVDDFMNLVKESKTDLPPIDLSSIDFDADMSTVSGKRAVFVRNIAAIRIMKQLEATNREATPEEAKVLQSYAGFGGMPEVFDSFNASWTNEFHTLEKELTAEEYKTARESTLNAHFTPDNIVQSIYDGLSSLGFENGYVLEPSAGSGKFFLNMPEEMRKNSQLYGVELDSLTARIAAKAYNDVTMANQPFEQTNFADGSFDVAISNVPFGDYRVTSDNKYRGKRFYVHDYFINKMIDEVRPGGLVVAITSKGTMEKDNVAAREEIARKAELVTAIRLPDDTFKEAGTSVTTDILVFKKRDMPLTKAEIEDKKYSDSRWVYLKDDNSSTGYEPVNAYFTKNIGNVLGKFEETTTPWGKDLTVKSSPDIDVNAKIKEIFASVGKIYEPSNEVMPLPAQTQIAKSDFMGFVVENGEVIFHKSDGTTETPELTDREKRKVISAIQLRDITRELFKAQRNNCSDEELREHQKKLNQAYDEYNRLFGRLYKDRTLKNIFKDDPSYGLLLALEVYNKDGFQGKADIFTKRTISPDITPTHADSAADALAISIGETGSVNFPYMEELTGLSYDEIRKDLEFTSIYQDTDGSFYTSDEFLSGNIRRKIAKTEIALAEAEAQEKELLAKVDGDEWKTPPVYNMTSPHEHYLQERIDRALEKGGRFVQENEGRLDIAPDKDTQLYIHNKVAENDKDFLLFITGAAGNLRRLNATATEAKKNPLFVLDALKYKISATYSYSYDGNLGVVSECLRVMGLNQEKILKRVYESGLNGEDHEWYTFLREKFTKENPFAEDDEMEKAKFFENLKGEWEDYRTEYDQNHRSLAEEKFPDEAKAIKDKKEWLEKNLSALKEVCPEDIPIESIKVGLGTTFIPPYMIKDFLIENLDLNYREQDNLKVIFEPITGEWKIEGKNVADNLKVWQTYGTSKINALALVEKALNFRNPRVEDEIEVVEDGETKLKKVVNVEETSKAQMKQDELKHLFVDWLYKNEEYKEWIHQYYNEHFNAIRPREYNGEMLKFPRMNPAITLKPHQKDAIAHTIFGGNTLLAHAVGAGKTYEMVASAMESKRLGFCNKPLIVVPKHLTEQTGKEFLDLYPDANILVATKKDFEAQNRKAFCSKIATQNWDAVILGYTQFEQIPITNERKKALAEAFVDELIEAKSKLEDGHGTRYFSVKALAKMIRSSEEKIASLDKEKPKDDAVFFEDLGVDRLYVDEAHFYKNLWTYTKMRNVAGISTSHAGKSQDILEKIRYIQEINNGKGVIFATGTPISNSMTEFFTMQKYLQPELLKENNITNFDAWASTFGQTTTGMEIAPEGKGFREKTRFSKFHNLPELMSMFKEIADIKTADMLNLPVPECEYVVEEIERSEAQKEMVDRLAERAMAVRNKQVKPDVDNMLNITNEGRDLALDERIINSSLPEPEDSKVKRCVKNVLQTYKDSEDVKGTQIIFCDRSTPKNDGTFSVYDDIKKKLIAGGIKPEEIEFVQNANTEEKKDLLFEKVRKGKVRVLLGGTKNLGVGTNVQDKLIATHDLDVPWTPADLEQRKGRIVRAGNTNPKVKVFRYVTKGTFDSYMWQLIENKQRFISQIMTSKTPTRETEDCDELTLSAAEIKALSAGDPLIREMMDVNNEFTRLKIAKSSYLESKEHTKKLVTTDYPIRIKNTKKELDKFLKDKELFDKNTKFIDGVEDFSITINKKTYLDKKEGIKALGEALEKGDLKKFSGEYKGFKLACVQDSTNSYLFTTKLACSYMNTFYLDLYAQPSEQLKALDRIGQKINKEVETLKTKLEQLEHNLEVAKGELDKPFSQEARFKELENRGNEIMEILAAKDKGLTEQEDISREVRINRIRKIVDNPALLPENDVARDYLTDIAQTYNKYGEDNFLEVLDDEESFQNMVERYNHKPKDVADVLAKYSPKLPSVTYLHDFAQNYKSLTANYPPKIAAYAR